MCLCCPYEYFDLISCLNRRESKQNSETYLSLVCACVRMTFVLHQLCTINAKFRQSPSIYQIRFCSSPCGMQIYLRHGIFSVAFYINPFKFEEFFFVAALFWALLYMNYDVINDDPFDSFVRMILFNFCHFEATKIPPIFQIMSHICE